MARRLEKQFLSSTERESPSRRCSAARLTTSTRRTRLELLSVSHRWLSPTPLEPGSKGWDAGQPRMITFAHFRDLALPANRTAAGPSRTDVVVANTHWDDRGLRAREESARLIRRFVEEEIQQAHARAHTGEGDVSEEPLMVLLGDLNSPSEEAGYQVLTGRRYLCSGASERIGANDADKPDSTSKAPRSFFDARHELVRRGDAKGGTAHVGGGAMSRYVSVVAPTHLHRLSSTGIRTAEN